MEPLMTVKETSDYFKVHHQTVLRWIRSGKLSAIKLASTGHYRIDPNDVRRLIEEHSTAA